MKWIPCQFKEVSWWGEIVCESSCWHTVASPFNFLPYTKKFDEEISSELLIQYLGEEVDIGNQGTLENDWHVGCVEEFDWVWLMVSSYFLTGHGEFNSESLRK
jgi:hypothetical protein